MIIKIQSIHFDADQKLIDFIQKKMDKLDTFFDRVTDAEVYLKLEKDISGNNKVVQIKLNIPGNAILAKEQAAWFEEATDKAYETLKRQLSKHKDKVSSH